MSDEKPRLTWLQEFASAARALWDPKTVLVTLIAIACGAVAGQAWLEKPAVGAAFVIVTLGFVGIARTIAFPQVSFGEFAARAKETSIGAAIVLAAVILWCATMNLLMVSVAKADTIPAMAYQHLPTLQQEARDHWAAPAPAPMATIAGLIDHETACPRASTCWQASAMYKTQREEGRGLGMFTRALTADGKLRFDAFTELKALHPNALRDATWESHKTDARIQARAVILKVSDNMASAIRITPIPAEQLAFAVTMHNRGVQGVMNEIALCGMTRGCDRTRWRGHVERTCTASRAVIPGTGRSACDISRAYFPDIERRSAKYAGLV